MSKQYWSMFLIALTDFLYTEMVLTQWNCVLNNNNVPWVTLYFPTLTMISDHLCPANVYQTTLYLFYCPNLEDFSFVSDCNALPRLYKYICLWLPFFSNVFPVIIYSFLYSPSMKTQHSEHLYWHKLFVLADFLK